MLKRFTAILLLVSIAMSNCESMLVYAGFELNQDYIAKNLCVNRDRPLMHCDGKCYLAKKLKQADEKQKNNARQEQKNRLQQIFWSVAILIRFHTSFKRLIAFPENKIALPKICYSILKPPPLA